MPDDTESTNPSRPDPPPASSQPIIETRGLVRRFGDKVAVDGIDLAVPRGSFFGFLGPNGAGKTTTVRMLTGLLAPTAGEALIDGRSIEQDPVAIKQQIGVVPDSLALFDRLSLWEHLTMVGRIHGLSQTETESRGQELLTLLGLWDDRGVYAVDASHGMRKKTALAIALLHAPELLFLDEPFEGIDPIAGKVLRDLLRRLSRRGDHHLSHLAHPGDHRTARGPGGGHRSGPDRAGRPAGSSATRREDPRGGLHHRCRSRPGGGGESVVATQRTGVTVLSLLPYLWRAYWRDVGKRGVWRNANMASVTAFGIIGLPVYAALLIFAVVSYREGALDRGLLLIEMALTSIFVTWLMLPLLVSSVSGRGQGLELVRMRQFPLSILQLFQIGVLASLIQPVYWILLLASILSLVAVGFSPQPLLGIGAGMLLVVSAAVLSWALGLLLAAVVSSRRGRELGLGFLAFAMAPLWFVLTGDLEYEGGALTMTIADHNYLLFDETGRQGLLTDLRAWTPSAWVTAAAAGTAPVRGVLFLLVLLGGSLAVALLSLRRQVSQPPETMGSSASRQRSIGPILGLPAPLGAATAKELRYLSRTLDALMGYVGGAIAAIWMLVRPDNAPWVIALVMPAVVFNEMVIPLNNFGLDRGAVDRYRLLPLSSRQVILSKNIAYVTLVVVELALPLLVALFRVGVPYTLACLCGCLSVCCLTMTWGNFVSVRSPAAREFFNFDSSEQAGGLLPILYALLIWLVPGGLGVWLMQVSHWAFLGGELILLIGAALIWFSTLDNAGRQFATQA
ncbi:MAG: ABC transporter ATP-binding protein, partial [bacterium]